MSVPNRAEWIRRAKWGVFCHYLADHASASTPTEQSVDAWNARVDAFDVPRLVRQLQSIGAPYFGLTIGQNSGFYCSPNATYDRIVGREPSRCSRRDLIGELATALRGVGVRFMAYLPSGAPENDELARSKFRWGKVTPDRQGKPASPGERLAEFQQMWEAVIREWSTRWGELVSAWWIDGVYYARQMYQFDDAPHFASFLAALRAGNPDAAIALNPGVLLPVVTVPESGEDFTAGEVDQVLPVDFGRPRDHSTWPGGRVGDAQLHLLIPLGTWWGREPIRFHAGFVREYTQHIVNAGGAVTWDVPMTNDGAIPQNYLDALASLRELREA